MRRPLLALLVLLFAIALVSAQAWVSAGQTARQELLERGQGVADVLVAALQESRVRARSLEEREHLRLEAVARRLRAELALPQGPAAQVLERLAEEERLGRAYLFGAGGARLTRVARGAGAPGGEPADGLGAEAEWRGAARVVAPLLDGDAQVVREEARPNVFGTLHRVSVGVRTEGGALLVEADARDVAALRLGADLGQVLAGVCRLPDVRYARLAQGEDVIAQSGEAPRPGDGLTFEREVAGDGGPALSVQMGVLTARTDDLVGAARRQIALWALLAAAVATLGVLVLARRAQRQERERRQASAEQVEQRHLAEMGVLTGLLVHELSSPLNALALQVSALERTLAGAAAPDVTRIKQTLGRARSALESFLHLAPAEPRPTRLYGAQDLARTLEDLGQEQAGARFQVQVDPAAAGRVVAVERAVFDQALRNVLRNALQASPPDGRVSVRWEPGPQGGVRVCVRDQGAGLPPEILRGGPVLGLSKRPGGHGLGLFLARRVASGAGGSLVLGAAPGGGAEVTFDLPARAGGDA